VTRDTRTTKPPQTTILKPLPPQATCATQRVCHHFLLLYFSPPTFFLCSYHNCARD
jgi:hypothetical protein